MSNFALKDVEARLPQGDLTVQIMNLTKKNMSNVPLKMSNVCISVRIDLFCSSTPCSASMERHSSSIRIGLARLSPGIRCRSSSKVQFCSRNANFCNENGIVFHWNCYCCCCCFEVDFRTDDPLYHVGLIQMVSSLCAGRHRDSIDFILKDTTLSYNLVLVRMTSTEIIPEVSFSMWFNGVVFRLLLRCVFHHCCMHAK